MVLQKSIKFCSVLSFEANGLILNYWFSSLISEETPKFQACMNTYNSWKQKRMDKELIFQEFLNIKQHC